jgi:hypothetical protein
VSRRRRSSGATPGRDRVRGTHRVPRAATATGAGPPDRRDRERIRFHGLDRGRGEPGPAGFDRGRRDVERYDAETRRRERFRVIAQPAPDHQAGRAVRARVGCAEPLDEERIRGPIRPRNAIPVSRCALVQLLEPARGIPAVDRLLRQASHLVATRHVPLPLARVRQSADDDIDPPVRPKCTRRNHRARRSGILAP